MKTEKIFSGAIFIDNGSGNTHLKKRLTLFVSGEGETDERLDIAAGRYCHYKFSKKFFAMRPQNGGIDLNAKRELKILMKIEIEIPDLHEIAKRELKEKGFMQSIQKTKEATHKLIEDQGISAIALIIAETLDQVLEHRELPVIGLHEEAESISG